MERVIVVDENFDHRFAKQLTERGRRAFSYKQVGTGGLEDEHVIKKIVESMTEPWVLLTADDSMPAEHAELIAEVQATIATIDGEWKKHCQARGLNLDRDQFSKEAAHRWAHSIAEQEEGRIERYTPSGHTRWAPRDQHIRKVEARLTAESTAAREA